ARAQVPVCLECKRRPGDRRRGLCWSCFRSKKVRMKFPSFATCPQLRPRGHKALSRKRREDAARPTGALPGTPEKILILQLRACCRLPLFVAGDAEASDTPALLGARYQRPKSP